jgi:hypothetical protein
MRIVQAIQAFAALSAAIVITFLQPQRDEISVGQIGIYGLLVIASLWAVSHVVMALVQRKMRSYISNGVIVVLIGVLLAAVKWLEITDQSGATNSAFVFFALATAWLILGGLTLLLLSLSHRKFPKVFRDNLITSIIFLVPGISIALLPMDAVWQVGLFNTACIFTAVHLGIAATSPSVAASQSTQPATSKTKA